MLTRPTPINTPLLDAAELTLFRLFRRGIFSQVARIRGYHQMQSWSRDRLGYHA